MTEWVLQELTPSILLSIEYYGGHEHRLLGEEETWDWELIQSVVK